jgi:carbonic anhydrase/acetyltransferase-like protein (isoleucine patch superfamily)
LTTDIGPGATVGHNCVVHGAILEAECLVANGSVVLDGATIGVGALVAAGSVVAAGTTVAAGMLVTGAPAVVRRPVKGSGTELWVETNPESYAELAQRHRYGIRYIDPTTDDDNDE